ncbi:MAG: RNA polymerase sigma factor [Terriglobales bacterium]
MESRTAANSDDDALIRAAQKGDRSAFDDLVCRHDQNVLRLARGLARTEQDAWDIYQETFIKAYRSLSRFRFECSFYTWVYRIATNTGLDYLRRQATRREVAAVALDNDGEPAEWLSAVPDAAPAANPERLLLGGEVGTRIEMALRRLSPRERMVFEMKHYQGLRLRTIGEILETTEETVKNALFRATQKLRNSLGDLVRSGPAVKRSGWHASGQA